MPTQKAILAQHHSLIVLNEQLKMQFHLVFVNLNRGLSMPIQLMYNVTPVSNFLLEDSLSLVWRKEPRYGKYREIITWHLPHIGIY